MDGQFGGWSPGQFFALAAAEDVMPAEGESA
jgi:hypothetical protein